MKFSMRFTPSIRYKETDFLGKIIHMDYTPFPSLNSLFLYSNLVPLGPV